MQRLGFEGECHPGKGGEAIGLSMAGVEIETGIDRRELGVGGCGGPG